MTRQQLQKLITAGVFSAALLSGVAYAADEAPQTRRAPRRQESNAGAGQEHKKHNNKKNMPKHGCAAKNDCKGQGGCKTSDGGCSGKNSCKGKGAAPLTAARCQAKSNDRRPSKTAVIEERQSKWRREADFFKRIPSPQLRIADVLVSHSYGWPPSSVLKHSDFESLPVLGARIGLRKQHFQELKKTDLPVGWLEIVPENFMNFGGFPQAMLDLCASRWPIVSHGVNLSIGSTDPLNEEYVARLKRSSNAPGHCGTATTYVFTSVGGEYFHDLLPLPFRMRPRTMWYRA